MPNKPAYPLIVIDLEDGSKEVFDTEEELACTVEWCNSDDPSENLRVVDAQGREIRLKIEALQVLTCEIRRSQK